MGLKYIVEGNAVLQASSRPAPILSAQNVYKWKVLVDYKRRT